MSDRVDLWPGVNVSHETFDRLKALQALLQKWNPAINLVSKSTLEDAWQRHILDSAQLFLLAPPRFTHWADLGSGGGFPGLVIACLAMESAPDANITLVESDQRKAAFLMQAARSLNLTAKVAVQRIEVLQPLGADVLSARALASLDNLCGFAARHLVPGGICLFPKGANHQAEVDEARKNWAFDLSATPSRVEPAAVVLTLKGLAHV